LHYICTSLWKNLRCIKVEPAFSVLHTDYLEWLSVCVWNDQLEKWLPVSGPLLHTCTPKSRRDILGKDAFNPWLDLH
jgi:hypothetical protein